MKEEVIVVTGGGGFIGHHLVKHLMNCKKVVVLDNFVRGTLDRLKGLEDKVIIRNCDITNYDSIEKCLNCLLYTSPSPRDGLLSRMPSSA